MGEAKLKRKLERFVVNNPDLEKLERQVSNFNIFEALGAVRQELRHSDFLSFILDPSRPHGLDDLVLKEFLKDVVYNSKFTPFSAIDADTASLEDVYVRREWNNIDLLIEAKDDRMLVAIENKIDSSEKPNALERYTRQLERKYPEYKGRILKIFLTPEGDTPSQQDWQTYSYKRLSNVIQSITRNRKSMMGNEVLSVLTHYNKMLRRHIVPDENIEELCRKIYREHKEAIDLIVEHKPDMKKELADYLKELVREEDGLELDDSSKTSIRFAISDWDSYSVQELGEWTDSGRLLLFIFRNDEDKLKFRFIVGPGPDKIRQQLYEVSFNSNELDTNPKLAPKYTYLHKRYLDFEDGRDELSKSQMQDKVEQFWSKILKNELPKIRKHYDEVLAEKSE